MAKKLRLQINDDHRVVREMTVEVGGDGECEELVKTYMEDWPDYTVDVYDAKTGRKLHAYENVMCSHGELRLRDRIGDGK